ncbi:MAG: HmuY family protein [Rhizobacter sp.]|nr:HmuY family protein [Ferruginibacter sp.]
MNFKKIMPAVVLGTLVFSSCKKDIDPVIIVPPSGGASVQFDGILAGEAGSSAGKSVYIDLSTNISTGMARKSWDLGFYSGSDFRVIINNTTTATAKIINKNDLSDVTVADTIGFNGMSIGFNGTSWPLVDDSSANITKTVIPEVSATDANNKVVIINCGVGGTTPARDIYKIRILRSASGYKLQYAKLAATTFTTLDITKDAAYNFQYVSFDTGLTVVEPKKAEWDFNWSYKLYKTFYGDPSVNAFIPYAFSDLITINSRAGVQAAQVLTSTVTYADYAEANISTSTFLSTHDAISDKWRSTQPATGVRTDRFYVIKDGVGNYYKLKFLSMGVGDGGTRGKPQFEYKLVKAG